MARPDLASSKNNRTQAHKEKALVEYMIEGMGNRTVNSQFSTNPDSNNHETNLIDLCCSIIPGGDHFQSLRKRLERLP